MSMGSVKSNNEISQRMRSRQETYGVFCSDISDRKLCKRAVQRPLFCLSER